MRRPARDVLPPSAPSSAAPSCFTFVDALQSAPVLLNGEQSRATRPACACKRTHQDASGYFEPGSANGALVSISADTMHTGARCSHAINMCNMQLVDQQVRRSPFGNIATSTLRQLARSMLTRCSQDTKWLRWLFHHNACAHVMRAFCWCLGDCPRHTCDTTALSSDPHRSGNPFNSRHWQNYVPHRRW